MSMDKVLSDIRYLNEQLKKGWVTVDEFTRQLDTLVDKAERIVDDLMSDMDAFS